MAAEQRIQIKRRASAPTSTSAWQGLLDGELGYIKDVNELYIGNGKGVTPTLISSLSWNKLTNKPTRFTYQVYVDANDPTKLIDKNIQNIESTIGYFAPLTNGLIDLKYLPQGALERLVKVADTTARYKLTTSQVQLGDTVQEVDTGVMYIVVDETKLNSADGYQYYSAGRAAAVDWSGVENKPNASQTTAGLMTAADKKKLDYTNVAYGTCTTAADVAAKVITINGNTGWKLTAGSMISIFFSYTNTAQNPTFNVNSSGAKNVYFNQSQITTSNLKYAGYTNRICNYIYDGTQFRFHSWGYDADTNTQVRVYRQDGTSYNADYPLIASRTKAADLGTVGTESSYEAVYGLISDTNNNIPTTNPYTGESKFKTLTISGNATATKFIGPLQGNADTATKLKTARTITLSGGAIGTATSFDGSSNITIPVTDIRPSYIGDGYTSKGFYINTHPENSPAIIPFINNDIAYLLKRGGSAIIKYDGVVQNIDISNIFDGSPSYWYMNPTNITEIVIELTLHKAFTWTNTVYVDMGSNGWRAKNIKLEVMNSEVQGDVWVVKREETNRNISQFKYNFGHTPVGESDSSKGFNKIRLTFSNWNNATIFRIAQIGIINYGSFGLRETFLPKDGGEVYGNISPYNNNSYNLGTSSKKWNNVYANVFNGNLTGNADTATILKNARTLTIGNTGKTFNGSANVSWTLAEIGAVAKAGDTMTGFLTLHANPTANLHAATKQYVDAVNAKLANYLPLAGGNMTGHIYMTGSKASSGTSNTTQLIFGTSSVQHVAVTSNDKALVINPNSSATTNQIVLYLNKQSVFPGGIKISAGNLDVSGTSTLTGAVTAKSTVTLAKDPVQNLEAATKQYVDNNNVIIYRITEV